MCAHRVNLQALSGALVDYIRAYRAEYATFTAPQPGGEGYPSLPQSPFMTPFRLDCMALEDGMLLWERSHEPEGPWYAWGGPAIKVDYPHTRMPLQIRVLLGMRGAHRRPEGIYRAVTPRDLPEDVWFGRFGTPTDALEDNTPHACPVRIRQYAMTWREALRRATFGFFGDINEPPEPDPRTGMPLEIACETGIVPADLNSRPFYNYLAVDTATHPDHWRDRLEPSRVRRDVRRDFARTIAALQFRETDTVAQMTDHRLWLTRFRERQSRLQEAMDTLAHLLETASPVPGAALQALFQRYPMLLDPHGQSVDTGTETPGLHVSRQPYQDYSIFHLAGESGGVSSPSYQSLLQTAKAAVSIQGYRATMDNRNTAEITPFPPARFRIVSIGTQVPADIGMAPVSHGQEMEEESPLGHIWVTPDDLLQSARSACLRWKALEPFLPD